MTHSHSRKLPHLPTNRDFQELGTPNYSFCHLSADPSQWQGACQEQRFSFLFVRGQRLGTACLGCSLVLKVPAASAAPAAFATFWWQHLVPPGFFASVLIFCWLQKASLATSLAWNLSSIPFFRHRHAPSAGFLVGASRISRAFCKRLGPLRSPCAVLCPFTKCVSTSFLMASDSNVKH